MPDGPSNSSRPSSRPAPQISPGAEPGREPGDRSVRRGGPRAGPRPGRSALPGRDEDRGGRSSRHRLRRRPDREVVGLPGRRSTGPGALSGKNRVDPARLALVAGAAGVRRASPEEARDATGFAVGGTPPFGHGSPVRTFLDEDLLAFDEVWA